MTHAAAWLIWVGAVLVILSTTRNPWYVGLVLITIAGVKAALRSQASNTAPIPISIIRFGAVVISFSAVFNALTVHFGDTVLFSVPDIIPFFGGLVTLEALIYGALNGLVLTGLFAAFTVFNQAVPVKEMIRLVPRAFFPVAVMTSIAVTFVPVTLRQYRDIRAAQAVRGHRLRGLRDWLPLVMPLLVGGLERALQLAEAMTARGFAGAATPTHNTRTKIATVLGLGLLAIGWLLRSVWGFSMLGLFVLGLGISLIVGVLWQVSRQVPRTVYRPQPWTIRDGATIAGAALAALLFAVSWPGLDRSSIFYYPYPHLTQPLVQPWLALATLGLLLPALIALRLPVSKSSKLKQPKFGASKHGTEYDSF